MNQRRVHSDTKRHQSKKRNSDWTLQRVAIDRPSKFAFVQLVQRADTRPHLPLWNLFTSCSLSYPHVLTNNGIQFAHLLSNRKDQTAPFPRTSLRQCVRRPRHPTRAHQTISSLDQWPGRWMNRTIKEAIIQRYNYDHPRTTHRSSLRMYLWIGERRSRRCPKTMWMMDSADVWRSSYLWRGVWTGWAKRRCVPRSRAWARSGTPFI